MDINLKANHFKRNTFKIGDDPTQFYIFPYIVNNGVAYASKIIKYRFKYRTYFI